MDAMKVIFNQYDKINTFVDVMNAIMKDCNYKLKVVSNIEVMMKKEDEFVNNYVKYLQEMQGGLTLEEMRRIAVQEYHNYMA